MSFIQTWLVSPLKTLFYRVEIQAAIKTGVAAGFGWAVGMWSSHLMQRPDTLVSGMWCTMTAIVVLQAHLGGTYQAALNRFLGIFIGSMMGGFFTVMLGSDPFSLTISVFWTIVLCSMVGLKESVRIASMSVAVVMVLWGMRPEVSPWTFALYRLMDSTMGIIVAVLIAHTLWPSESASRLRLNVADVLSSMSQLYQLISLKEPVTRATEDHFNKISDEINAKLQKDKEYLEGAKLELLIQPVRLDNWTLVHNNLEQLYQESLTIQRVYGQMRLIVDPSLLQQLERMMSTIDLTLQQISRQLSLRQSVGDLSLLLETHTQLQLDLIRFRSTRATRQFNLEDVEGFFTFFYSLNGVIEAIEHIATKINDLYATTDE